MKRLDIKHARDLYLTPLPGARPVPCPFPGRWPTRIAFEGQLGGKRFAYVGKPSLNAMNMISHPVSGVHWYVEFDRKNLVFASNRPAPAVWNFYHPGIAPGWILAWWPRLIPDKKTVRFAKRYRVYRPTTRTLALVKELLADNGWFQLLGLDQDGRIPGEPE